MNKTNSILLAALGGAAIAALVANYLSTENGKELLSAATDKLSDLKTKATDYAKNNLAGIGSSAKDTLTSKVHQTAGQQN
jgi:hypothetical protein